jgi:hypothetical protein
MTISPPVGGGVSEPLCNVLIPASESAVRHRAPSEHWDTPTHYESGTSFLVEENSQARGLIVDDGMREFIRRLEAVTHRLDATDHLWRRDDPGLRLVPPLEPPPAYPASRSPHSMHSALAVTPQELEESTG